MDPADCPKLRPDVELVSGFDDVLLLYVKSEGRYVKLGAAAAELIPYLDGKKTVQTIALNLVAERGVDIEVIQVALQRLITEFAQIGLLDGVPRKADESFRSRFSRTPTKRFPIFDAQATARLIRPVTFLVDRLRLSALFFLITFSMTILAGAALGILVSKHIAITSPEIPFISLSICLLATIFHELSHAIVCHLSGYPVRSLGFALWYYFIPVAYVDRTDTYRVRSRAIRVAISLAGPASDMFWCAAGSLCLLSGIVDYLSPAGQVIGGCIFFLLVGLIGNFNPLLPSDGQQAVEAAIGVVNLRNRAVAYALDIFSGQKLDNLSIQGPKTVRLMYLFYGVACCLYIVVVAGMMIWFLISMLSFYF